MAKYRVVRSHCLGGGIDVWQGDEIELSERDAQSKVAAGWITPIPDEPPPAAPPEASGSGPDEHGEPTEPASTEESTDPAPAAGRRRR